MLLNKDKVRALEIARELYTKEPANPVFVSTYAFALYCMGENPKALEVMKKLKPEELQDPSVAAYYSAILTKAGLKSEAESYAKIGRNAALLPEEERILNLAPATPAQ